MKVSVLTPTFRRTKEVVEAAKSVLNIKDLKIEHLICDDSPEFSAQGPLSDINDDRLIYHRMPRPTGGFPGQVRNYLARKATGEYFYFLDDDDRVNAEVLPEIIERMDQSRINVAVCNVEPFGNHRSAVDHEVRFFSNAAKILERRPSARAIAGQLLFKEPILVCSACVVKKSVFESLGGFDDTMTPFEDTEFFLRAIRTFGYSYVPLPLLERRCGEACLSSALSPEKLSACYRNMRSKYRKKYGLAEYSYLRLSAKVGALKTKFYPKKI